MTQENDSIGFGFQEIPAGPGYERVKVAADELVKALEAVRGKEPVATVEIDGIGAIMWVPGRQGPAVVRCLGASLVVANVTASPIELYEQALERILCRTSKQHLEQKGKNLMCLRLDGVNLIAATTTRFPRLAEQVAELCAGRAVLMPVGQPQGGMQ